MDEAQVRKIVNEELDKRMAKMMQKDEMDDADEATPPKTMDALQKKKDKISKGLKDKEDMMSGEE